MSAHSEESNLVRHAPYFPVRDLEGAIAHYETVLGFVCDYRGGNPARFAILSRDGLALMFRLVSEDADLRPNERQGGTWDVFFWVRDAQALFDELDQKGVDVAYGPRFQAEYRMKEFAVRDPEGYVLGFGQEWDDE